MKLYLSSCALALLAASAASAADLGRAPAPMPTVAPATVFDAYVSMAAGYSWGKNTLYDVDNDGVRLQGRGSFSYNFAPTYGFQGDAVFGRDWAKYSEDDDDDLKDPTTDITLASHLFWRDPSVGAFGLLAQYTGMKTRFDYGGSSSFSTDTDHLLAGIEGQYFLGAMSLYGQLAYHYADTNYYDADGGGVSAVAQLRYFATPDWMIGIKGGYDRVTLSGDIPVDMIATTWLAGVRTEYKPSGSPFSFFGEVTYSDAKLRFEGYESSSDRETRAMIGFKYNFTAPSLLDRERSGSSFDPIEVRGRYIPFS